MQKNQFEVRTWKHKETGKVFKVLPWWECSGTIIEPEDAKKTILQNDEDEWKDRLFAIGCLVQIGWLLENENGVWLGLGPTAKDAFNEIIA